MKKLFTTLMIILSLYSFGQVGVNTTDPKATLDVVASPSDATKVDGFIAPRLTGAELKSKDALYQPTTPSVAGQTGAIVYITTPLAVTDTSAKTINVTYAGYYYFNGSQWVLISPDQNPTLGDIKSGFQTSDHSGWVKLDGRLKSSLSASQQTIATSLGFGTNLPDATNSYLVQNGTALGNISNSNTRTIQRNQLPNVPLTGTTNTVQPEVRYDIKNGTNPNRAQIANGSSTVFLAADNTNGIGVYNDDVNNSSVLWQNSHSHTFNTESINGGVSQQTLNIQPQSMSVNMFVYLGN